MNITKDGVEVKVGQVWRDLDKRMNGRTRTVLAVADGKATIGVADGLFQTKVSIRRMHKSSTGWEMVSNVAIQGLARSDSPAGMESSTPGNGENNDDRQMHETGVA